MIATWPDLLSYLTIDDSKICEKDINALLQWCSANVSQDVCYEGSLGAKHTGIKKYLTSFFETIMVNKDKGLESKNSALYGMNIIQYAALKGYEKFIQQSLLSEVNRDKVVNEATEQGMTPLHFAVLNGHIEAVDILLQQGANPYLKNKLGLTTLEIALELPVNELNANKPNEVKLKKSQLFNKLRKITPDSLDIKDMGGNTVAHFMALNDFADLLKDLKDEKFELLSAKNYSGRSPLHIAIVNKQLEATMVLAQLPELLTITDEEGRTPLHYAARYGNKETLLACLTDSSAILRRDYSFKTPLLCAAETGKEALVDCLIEKGASIQDEDIKGFNALQYAAFSGNLSLVKKLVESTQIDINQIDKQGRTALFNLIMNYAAINDKQDNIIEYLVAHGSDITLADIEKNTVVDYLNKPAVMYKKIHDHLYNKLTTGCKHSM